MGIRQENQADTSVLETLKVGDTVLVQRSTAIGEGRGKVIEERKVVKVTPTQIHVELRLDYSNAYDRRTGFIRGSYQSSVIVDPTHPMTLEVLENSRTVAAKYRLDAAIRKYQANSLDSDAVRGVLTAATHLAGRLDVKL